MPLKSYIWLITDVLYNFFGSVSYVLISFLIWENGKSLDLILIFNLYIFITLLLNGIVAGLISMFFSPKINYILSILAFIATFYYLEIFKEDIVSNIKYISILLGLIYSFLYNSRSLINQFIVPAELSVKYNSIKEILISASTLASPLVVNFAVESLG